MKKRQLIYIPEINPDSFVLLFSKGDSGDSFSIREYPQSGGVRVRYSDSIPFSLNQLFSMVKHGFDADTHWVDDEAFWRANICELNTLYLKLKEKPKAIIKKIEKTTVANKSFSRNDLNVGVPIGPFSIRGKKDEQILSVDDWFRFAPPKRGSLHWKDGRSAKELAKNWFRSGSARIPPELQKLLGSHEATRGFVPEIAFPEYVTRIDSFSGEHRNHDLVLVGASGKNKILICIEAKADESFGDPICKVKNKDPNSNILKRIGLLSNSLFDQITDKDLGQIKYQLLTGVTGTLIEAKNRIADYAVFVVYEFLSSQLDENKLIANTYDLNNFLRKIVGVKSFQLSEGIISEIGIVKGSVFVPGDIPLLVGKVSVEL